MRGSTHDGRAALTAAIAFAMLLAACGSGASTPQPSPTAPAAPTSASSPSPSASVAHVLAVGDIAGCEWQTDAATASLVAEREGTVLTLGDNVYPAGSDATYADCYGPTWGAVLDRTRPAIGNHDAQDDGGAAYFRYFGAAAGKTGEGWYSFDIGAWHVAALNSNCGMVRCDAGSPQHAWLVQDLAANGARCTLAYWHHPRFSSGPHGNDSSVAALWAALDEADADLVIAGHDHLYERFSPQTADGAADPNGVRQITAGTGGAGLYETEGIAANSELAIDDRFGILALTLRETSYEWQFITTDETVADEGRADCV